MSVPRLVVAAPASGAGKTTVATGLMAAFVARGLAVSPHKVGPDYIDPGYHALATGRPGRNLDPWLTGEDLIAPLFLHGSRGADIAVVEGVMGLFDGVAGQGELASTAHVAKLLRAPVVLVVDAASTGRSVAALVHGFVSYDSGVRIAGVILNRVGSDRHEQICRSAVEETGLPVLGVLRRQADVATPSRHLGLVPAAERTREAVETVRRLGDLIAETCNLKALQEVAKTAGNLTVPAWNPADILADLEVRGVSAELHTPLTSRSAKERAPVVAVAGGAAFTFGYAEHSELLAAAGAEVRPFDPLREERLPDGTRGLVIGGGFPEVYAAELSANLRLRKEVAELAQAGAPLAAECAGLLYLTKALDGLPMCGVLDAEARMTERLTLGYRAAVAVTDSVLTRAGERLRGHEFHRTVVEPAYGTRPLWQWSPAGPEGFVHGNCVASYLHLHWAGFPHVAHRFMEAC